MRYKNKQICIVDDVILQLKDGIKHELFHLACHSIIPTKVTDDDIFGTAYDYNNHNDVRYVTGKINIDCNNNNEGCGGSGGFILVNVKKYIIIVY